jgi:YHS domain-containing protein
VLRFVVLAILAILIYLLLRAAIRSFLAGLQGPARAAAPPRIVHDELVKDPVCETYVPRRTAIARTAGPVTRYFCSRDCASRFEARS